MPLQNSTAPFGVHSRPDALLPQPAPSTIDYALHEGPRGVLAHQSNLVSSAHSRGGFYPEGGLIPEVARDKPARGYVENRDQPFHATDDTRHDYPAQHAGVGRESLELDEWRARVAEEEAERRYEEEAALRAMGAQQPAAHTARRLNSRGHSGTGGGGGGSALQVWEQDDSSATRPSARNPSEQQMQSFHATRLFPGLRSKQDGTGGGAGLQMVERPARGAAKTARGSSAARGGDARYPPRPQSQSSAPPPAWPSARSYDDYDRAMQAQEAHAAAAAAAADSDDAAASPASPSGPPHPALSSCSPIANFNALRAAMSALDPGASALMTTLSPRSHSRQMAAYMRRPPPQPVRPRPYHPSLHAPRSARSGSSSSASGAAVTANLTRPYPHRQPFLPCNPAQARAIFKDGPFLAQTQTPSPPSQQQQQQQSNRARSAQGLRPSQPLLVGAGGGGGGGDGAPVLRLRDSTAPAIPFRGSTSVQAARESTAVDYFLNSPDASIKRLERSWVCAQSRANRAAFVARLADAQRAERHEQARQAAREGRVVITHAMPPRPLSFSDGLFKAH